MRYREWREKVAVKREQKGIAFPVVGPKTYARREKRLKEAGLLDWERFWLVAHRLDTRGMRFMRDKRRAMHKKALEEGLTPQQFRKRIGAWYKNNGWTFLDGTLNPFKMLEWFRDKANADVTPTPKVRHRKKDFKASKKRTREERREQELDKAYHKKRPKG